MLRAGIAGIFLLLATAHAGAATLSIDASRAWAGDARGVAAAQAALSDLRGEETARAPLGVLVEDFEGFAPWPGGATPAPLATAVGTFSSLGGTGSGGSAVNGGTGPQVRDGAVFGRRNTTVGGANFLDSNDTLGVRWSVDLGGALFDRISFLVTDAADTGAVFTVSAAGFAETVSLARRGNGGINLIDILFPGAITAATLDFSNTRTNDGFGLDDLGVSRAPAAIPLPAAGLLLAGGLGALALLRRRRRAA